MISEWISEWMKERINDLWKNSVLISERKCSHPWPPDPKWGLTTSYGSCLTPIRKRFCYISCQISQCSGSPWFVVCFHFSTSNCELMPWCGVTGWPGFKFWYFLLSTLCESRTSHLLSLCSVNRSVYPCSTSLLVLLWGSRKIWSIQGFLFCFALFVFFQK